MCKRTVAIDTPSRKHNLKINIKAQLKQDIITVTENKIYSVADVSLYTTEHFHAEHFINL
jgi:hypothetical protein